MTDITKIINEFKAEAGRDLALRKKGILNVNLSPILENNSFYTNYLGMFKAIPYVENAFISDFDFDLLMRLVRGSFVIESDFVFPDNDYCKCPELKITADDSCWGFVSTLWSFQVCAIQRCLIKYSLYSHCLFHASPLDSLPIYLGRMQRLQKHNNRIDLISAARCLQ